MDVVRSHRAVGSQPQRLTRCWARGLAATCCKKESSQMPRLWEIFINHPVMRCPIPSRSSAFCEASVLPGLGLYLNGVCILWNACPHHMCLALLMLDCWQSQLGSKPALLAYLIGLRYSPSWMVQATGIIGVFPLMLWLELAIVRLGRSSRT